MTSSLSNSPNHCTHNNLIPLKSFGYQCSNDILTDIADNKTLAFQPSISSVVATTISSSHIKRQKSLTKSGELKEKSPDKSSMVAQPSPVAASGMVWRLTDEDCLEALPIILVSATAATTKATRKVKRRKMAKSNTNMSKEALPLEQFQQAVPLPYTTPTENFNVVAASDYHKPSKVECLAALPLRSVPGVVEAEPIVVPIGVKIPTDIEFHRRFAWLPVGWTMWRLIRVTGESINRVDTLYYTPNGKKCRSMKDVFYVLTKGRLPNANDSLHVDQEFEYEVPKEMVSWYGRGAGVTVHLTSINIRVLPGGTLSINSVNIPPIPPISVKRIKVPAGTPYKEIGTLVKPVRLLRKKYKLLRLLSREQV